MRFLRSNTRSGLSQYDCGQSHASVLYFTHYTRYRCHMLRKWGRTEWVLKAAMILDSASSQSSSTYALLTKPCVVWRTWSSTTKKLHSEKTSYNGLRDQNNTQIKSFDDHYHPKQRFNQYNRTQGIQLHSLLDSDSFSRQAAMTTQFKNHLQVPMTAGHSPTQALKCCWCLSNGPETCVVLHSWLYKGSNCLQSDFGLCLLTTHLTQTSAHWDLPDRNKPHCGRLCGTAARG